MWWLVVGIVALVIGALYVFRGSYSCRVIRRIETYDRVVEIVVPHCKEGLPHTTDGNTIRMTQAEWDSPHRETTLTHERVHLDQKRNRAIWIDFYRRYWDYEIYASYDELPPEYKRNLRPNPDTADAPYALWRNRWLFFSVYSPVRTLRDAIVKVWDTRRGIEVGLPEEWKAEFCASNKCPRQYEHPHELAAEFIAERPSVPAALKLFAWKQ
jgi:hypothetical protein